MDQQRPGGEYQVAFVMEIDPLIGFKYASSHMCIDYSSYPGFEHLITEQCTGLQEDEDLFWYEGDIGEFDNGDRFVIKCEDWLEFYVEWIGEPECENQARDFYRIKCAELIGNIHDNPDLLEKI